MKLKKKTPKKTDRLKPISLYPLKAEEALAEFMKVRPKKKTKKSKK